MSLFDYLNDQDDSNRDAADWPPPDAKAAACELCGGAGRVTVLDEYDGVFENTCPECDGSGWAEVKNG